MTPALRLRSISKSFGAHAVLSGIDLDIMDAEILALLGPSGCGKTTLLRIIAGLDQADQGRILFDGHEMSDLPPHRRRFGLMFQDYALFPHLNVQGNVGYGLMEMPKDTAAVRIAELLRMVGLAGCETRDVGELSGGEKQRVALARSLAPNPRLLMLDEPLAALDRSLRDHLALEIRNILHAVRVPAILVTHDQTEAFAMADRVAVMDRGRILQCAPPNELHAHPANTRVAHFLGLTNVLRNGELFENLAGSGLKPGAIVIRPEAAGLEQKKGAVPLACEVRAAIFRGHYFQIRVQVQNLDLSFILPTPLAVGQSVTLYLDKAKILFLPD